MVSFSTAYFKDGQLVTKHALLVAHWKEFKVKAVLEVFSILPLDHVFKVLGFDWPVLRLNRLIRISRWRLFLNRGRLRSTRPQLLLINTLLVYILLSIHLFACGGQVVGFGQIEVAPSNSTSCNAAYDYLKVIFSSTMILLNVGVAESPQDDHQRVYVILGFFFGFALLVTIASSAAKLIADFHLGRCLAFQRIDGVKKFLDCKRIPKKLHQKVLGWCVHLIDHQEQLDTLQILPVRMRLDILEVSLNA